MGLTDTESLQLIIVALNVLIFAIGFLSGQQR